VAGGPTPDGGRLRPVSCGRLKPTSGRGLGTTAGPVPLSLGGVEPARRAAGRSRRDGRWGGAGMTGDGPLGVWRLDGARGRATAPEWCVWRWVAVARFYFFSRSRFKSEAAVQTCGREKVVAGTTPLLHSSVNR
jgi:hypothetical protein